MAKAIIRGGDRKEITPKAAEIQVLAPKSGGMEITSDQPELDLGIEAERDAGGIGTGPKAKSAGLALLRQWTVKNPTPLSTLTGSNARVFVGLLKHRLPAHAAAESKTPATTSGPDASKLIIAGCTELD